MNACLDCGAPLAPDYPARVCASCLWGESTPSPGNDTLSVPGHEILEEIARGGMGVVYRARENETHRTVALKMLRPRLTDERGMRERFRIEARAAAALDHPSILPVYRVDEADDTPFFTMKLAAGGTLAARRDALGGKWREIGTLIATVAEAIHYAHQRGVLHRDIKPANILFDDAGQCYVSDFGLAKLVHTESSLTGTTSFLGTPHYSAPEVAAANAGAATVASDIWSLGAVLHELLAGRPPFDAPGIPALLRAIVDDPPAPLPPNVPRDLATISAKCLAKLPAARYATAAAFAADLRAWLDGRPIAARPLNTIARAWAYARRRPAIAALSSALVFALGFAAISLVRENRAAIAALTISRDAEKAARSAQADALLGEARAIRRANDVTRRDAAIDIVERSAKLRPSAAARDELLSLLALSALTESGVIRPSIHDRLWTPPRPDGDLTRYGAIADNAVSIRELRTAREIARVPSAPRSNYGAGPISPDGRWLIVRAEQATEVWDIAATKLLLSLPVLRGWTTFSNDGRFVALAPERGLSGTSLLCDLAANPPAARALETLPAQWHAFALSPDGKLLAITPNTSTSGLAIVDAATLAEVRRFETGSVGTLAAVQWNRAGDALFTGDNRGIVARWRPGMETPEWTLHAHEGAIHSLALTHGERTLATIGSDSLVKLWDLATLAPRGSLPWTGLSLAASRDGRTLLGQRSDPRSCPIFDCATPEICAMSALPPVALGNASQPGHPGVFAWPDSKHFIFTTGRDTHFVRDDATIESTLRLGLVDGYAIDAQTGGGIRVGGGAIMVHARGSTEEREIEGFKSSGPVVFHPSTRRLLVGNTLGAMGWTLGAEIQASDFGVPPHAGVWTAAWSPDGTRLAWAGPVKEGKNPLFFSAGIVDVEHRRELPPLAIGKRPYVKSLAFTADGSILVVGLLKEIMAFDVATGALRWRIPHERPPVHGPCLATAPGVLAATLGQQSVSLLDPATGAVRCTLTHPVERITHAIALSPDGKTLAVLAGALAQMWKLEVIEAELRRRGM